MPGERAISVISPLGDGVLLFQHMSAREQLGRLFEIQVQLASEDGQIKLSDLLGQILTIRVSLPDGTPRFFNGHVSQLRYDGLSGRYTTYQATLRPWLWFLTRTSNCRIFQDRTVPDIITEIFRDHGYSDFEQSLSGTYRTWHYCVQYRETDFGFVSRLMEQEGIYYFFRHEEGIHTLVLADSYSAHQPTEGYAEVPFYPPDEQDRRERDHLSEWLFSEELQPVRYALSDFDFERPRLALEVRSTVAREHDKADYEIYDYPGEYTDTGHGEAYVRARIEEIQAQYEEVQGGGNARGLAAGCLFTLTGHPRPDQEREYLLVSVAHELHGVAYDSGEPTEGRSTYSCRITAIDARQPYRSPRTTPKPIVQGPQTAIVAGPDGEEIWPDEYGRVKVRFHWDRKGSGDESSSCWIRVSQSWAGKHWGGMQIPHVGQEVIVEFLDGDPDRPIVTGRVYNASNMPPKELPALKHVSILRDGFGNQLTFDSTPGKEHIALFSPHHKSGLILGQSSVNVTYSDSTTVAMGNSSKHTYADQASYTHGNWFSFKQGLGCDVSFASSLGVAVGASVTLGGGAKFSGYLGTNISFTVGTNVTMGWARSINLNKAEYARISSKDIKMDSAKEVWLCGGADDPSLVKAGPDDITLTYGVGVKRSSVKNLGWWGTAAAGVGSLIAAGGQAAAQSVAFQSALDATTEGWKLNTAGDAETNKLDLSKTAGGGWGWVGQAAGIALAGAGAIAGVIGEDVKDPELSDEHAKITLNQKGAYLRSGKDETYTQDEGVKIAATDQGMKALIWLQKDGTIVVEAVSDVKIRSKGKIWLEQDVVFTETGEFKGKLWNQSFEAS